MSNCSSADGRSLGARCRQKARGGSTARPRGPLVDGTPSGSSRGSPRRFPSARAAERTGPREASTGWRATHSATSARRRTRARRVAAERVVREEEPARRAGERARASSRSVGSRIPREVAAGARARSALERGRSSRARAGRERRTRRPRWPRRPGRGLDWVEPRARARVRLAPPRLRAGTRQRGRVPRARRREVAVGPRGRGEHRRQHGVIGRRRNPQEAAPTASRLAGSGPDDGGPSARRLRARGPAGRRARRRPPASGAASISSMRTRGPVREAAALARRATVSTVHARSVHAAFGASGSAPMALHAAPKDDPAGTLQDDAQGARRRRATGRRRSRLRAIRVCAARLRTATCGGRSTTRNLRVCPVMRMRASRPRRRTRTRDRRGHGAPRADRAAAHAARPGPPAAAVRVPVGEHRSRPRGRRGAPSGRAADGYGS